MCGEDSGCNGCDGLLQLNFEGRTVELMFVMVCWS